MKLQAYLNFDGEADEAFQFYHLVFGGDFSHRSTMGEIPGGDELPVEEQNRIMHISLPIKDDIVLMGSDILPSAGHQVHKGNNLYISLQVDSRKEADKVFDGLSRGGKVEMPMEDQFWGDYYGSLQDRFGVHWMISYPHHEP